MTTTMPTAMPTVTADDAPDPNEQALVRLLAKKGAQLHALYDSAQCPSLLPLLRRHNIAHDCLFDGVKGITLCHVAPYLIGCQRYTGSPLDFVDFLWTKGVTMLVEAAESPEDIKTQLKKNAFVKNSDGIDCYFRYYDNRAFSRFMQIAKIKQLYDLYGTAIRAIYWLDPDEGDLLCLRKRDAGEVPPPDEDPLFEYSRLIDLI